MLKGKPDEDEEKLASALAAMVMNQTKSKQSVTSNVTTPTSKWRKNRV
jgi:hypothetical protein